MGSLTLGGMVWGGRAGL